MIKIDNKANCCGCSACAQVCPKSCVTMKADEEGFLYPIVNADSCINCKLCEKVCPHINNKKFDFPIKAYAVAHPDLKVRKLSSSGGAVTSIAEKIINNGGVVFGAVFDEGWNVKHQSICKIEDLKLIRGSKYVQSEIGNSTYIEVEKLLKNNKNVLIVGTPCQIRGLNLYLKKEYSNLITVDIICHGVPSPKVWQHYLSKYKKRGKIIQVEFRNKDLRGWEAYNFHLLYQNRSGQMKAVYEDIKQNPFMRGFIHDLYSRPSCSLCPAKNFNSGSDFTCGDFWGIKETYPEYYDENGVSILSVNTIKGDKFLKGLNAVMLPVDIEKAFAFNSSARISSKQHKFRSFFFKYYRSAISFKYFVLSIQIINKIFRIIGIR